MGRIAGRGTKKLQNKLYRAGLSLGVFAGTFVLAFIAASLLTPVDSSSAADSSSASTTVTYDFAPTIDISLSKANVDFNISANEFNKLKTDSLNVTVSTNNITGYTLSMTTDSSVTNGATITSGGTTQENVATNALVNTANNRHYVPSITSSITNPTDSTFPVNSWAYSISDPTATPVSMVYSPLPTAGSSTEIKKVTELDFPTDGSEATVDDTTPVTIATKADMSIPAGTYTNKLVFTAITNFNPEYDSYTIIYNSNGGEGDMTMVSHTGVHSGDSVMLYAPNYWRTGYGFLGWSTNTNATKYVPSTQSSLDSGEAYVYGPNETITVSDADIASANSDSTITLYAIWKASEGNMQSWTGCNAMSIGDVTALTDTRDNNVYAVAKLADGNCWSLENSRLSSGTIDSTTTNNPVSGFTWTESSNDWCTTQDATCYNQVMVNTNNINSNLTASPNTDSNSSSWYSYGTMYNWYAATAGKGTHEVSAGNVSGDICPTGWHLPTGASTGEFQAMYTAIGGTLSDIRRYPNNFVVSAYWYGPTSDYRGSYGDYWSSTAHDNYAANFLFFNSNNNVLPSNLYPKFAGFSVRCISSTTTIDGIDYIRLADGNWWTKNSQGTATWENAAALCPSGTHLPSVDEFTKLLTAYGGAKYTSYGEPYGWRDGDADLYNATGWSGYYWSSTEYTLDTVYAWRLGVYSSRSSVGYYTDKASSVDVVCVKS